MEAITRLAIYKFNEIVRAKKRLEGKEACLNEYVVRIPDVDILEYVRVTSGIEERWDAK